MGAQSRCVASGALNRRPTAHLTQRLVNFCKTVVAGFIDELGGKITAQAALQFHGDEAKTHLVREH